jgi:hypothetical protein
MSGVQNYSPPATERDLILTWAWLRYALALHSGAEQRAENLAGAVLELGTAVAELRRENAGLRARIERLERRK